MFNFKLPTGKRRCVTCRHFEDSSLEGSGWCKNPLRVDRDHLVLVRSTELACQTGWRQDDWEPSPRGRELDGPPAAEPYREQVPAEPPAREARREQRPRPPRDVPTANGNGHHSRGDAIALTQPLPETVVELQSQAEALDDTRVVPVDPPRSRGEAILRMQEEWRDEQLRGHPGKRCHNCHQFYPTGHGDVGWCQSDFAFEKPRLVEANGLACLTALGVWWQPKRLEPFDRSRR